MSIPNHDGSDRTPDQERFAEPPRGIGALRSTTSNVFDGRCRHPSAGAMTHVYLQAGRAVGLGLAGGALAGFGALIAMEAMELEPIPELMFVGPVIGALVGLAIAWRVVRPAREQTFVGADGIARVRDGRTEVVRFQDVTRVELTGGRYDATTFFGVVFHGADGRRFVIGGAVPDGRAPVHSPRHFADAAQAAYGEAKPPSRARAGGRAAEDRAALR